MLRIPALEKQKCGFLGLLGQAVYLVISRPVRELVKRMYKHTFIKESA